MRLWVRAFWSSRRTEPGGPSEHPHPPAFAQRQQGRGRCQWNHGAVCVHAHRRHTGAPGSTCFGSNRRRCGTLCAHALTGGGGAGGRLCAQALTRDDDNRSVVVYQNPAGFALIKEDFFSPLSSTGIQGPETQAVQDKAGGAGCLWGADQRWRAHRQRYAGSRSVSPQQRLPLGCLPGHP